MLTIPFPKGRTRRPASLVRVVRASGIAALAAVVLSGCPTDNTPTSYDQAVKDSFLRGCTANVPPIDGTTTTLASAGYCGCAYDVFLKMVPYNSEDREKDPYKGYPADKPLFRDLNNDLQNDPNKYNELPQNVRDAVKACPTEVVTTGSSAPVVGPVAASSTSTSVTTPDESTTSTAAP